MKSRRMAKISRVAVAILLVSVLSFAAAYVYARTALANSFEHVLPFTAVVTTSYYSGDGALGRKTTKLYVRYRDHKTAYEVNEVFPKQTPKLVDIIDVRSGQRTFLDPLTKSKSTFYYAPEHLRRIFLESGSESCPANVLDLEQAGVFCGLSTRHQVERLNPTWTEESWLVPELSCFAMKQIDYLSMSGKLGARDEEAVTSFTPGDPAPGLLPDPEDYTERTPQDTENEMATRFPGHVFGPSHAKANGRGLSGEAATVRSITMIDNLGRLCPTVYTTRAAVRKKKPSSFRHSAKLQWRRPELPPRVSTGASLNSEDRHAPNRRSPSRKCGTWQGPVAG